MKVHVFRTTCENCFHTFEAPVLSDQSYGLFLLFRQDYKSVKYLEAISSNALQEINSLLKGILRQKPTPNTFQKAWSRLIDSEEGFGFSLKLRCPSCREKEILIHTKNSSTRTMNLDECQFDQFLKAGSKEKISQIKSALIN